MSKLNRETRGKQRPRRAQRIDQMVAPIVRPVLKKHGFHELHIFEHWPEIVGADVARDCMPVKLSRGRGRDSSATLTIRVAGYRSLELQHMIPQIRDRLNRFLGGAIVKRIKLVQGPMPRDVDAVKSQEQPLSPAESQGISDAAAGIEDDRLRAAIERMGEGVRRRTTLLHRAPKSHR